MKERDHVTALLSGEVWLSTLEVCRGYEDPERGDPGEASILYRSGTINGNSDDAALQAVADRSGIHIGPGCTNITLSNNTATQRLADAWVICTTLANDAAAMEAFGPYCVAIAKPKAFFDLVSQSLAMKRGFREGLMGAVRYAQREYFHLDPNPGPLGFVKPPDMYAKQREFRMLWVPQKRETIHPFALPCPEIRSLVTEV